MTRPTRNDDRALQEVARKFAQKLVETAKDDDPGREAAFLRREAAREDAVTRALKEHQARKKKK